MIEAVRESSSDSDGDCVGIVVVEVERESSSESDGVALREVVVRLLGVADTDVEKTTERLICVDALLLRVREGADVNDGDGEVEVERESSSECDGVALSEVVVLVVVVAEGVVVGVTDVVRLADELRVVDSLLEALQLPVSSIVSVGVGGGVLVAVNDDDGRGTGSCMRIGHRVRRCCAK